MITPVSLAPVSTADQDLWCVTVDHVIVDISASDATTIRACHSLIGRVQIRNRGLTTSEAWGVVCLARRTGLRLIGGCMYNVSTRDVLTLREWLVLADRIGAAVATAAA